jgi:hypothetical protein
MKKQLLILVIAFFAIGLSTSYGQNCPTPRTVDPICLPSDALHPIAGTPYNYSITVPTPPGTKAYTWFVTQDQNFIVAGALTAARETPPSVHIASTGAGYNDPLTGTPTLSITWNSFLYDPLQPVFVVINVTNDDGSCTTQNMKVFKIQPVNAFTLDIANVNQASVSLGYDTPYDFCIHDVVTATYDATAPEGVIYDFGVDYMYFVVTAANFSTSWLPSVQLSGVAALETVTAVEWDLPGNAFAAPHAFTLAAGTWTSADPVPAVAAGGTVGTTGECIVIRVTLDHTNGANQYQGLTDEVITLAVDGITNLAGPVTIPDIHYSSTAPVANALCGLADGFQFDVATQTLKARPDITAPAMPAPGLLPVKP